MSLSIESGFTDFELVVALNKKDFAVLRNGGERAAFLQATFHHLFQLNETRLGRTEQRYFLDLLLHSPKLKVERFLTDLDHGQANGAISNMVRITSDKDQTLLRRGQWFSRKRPS